MQENSLPFNDSNQRTQFYEIDKEKLQNDSSFVQPKSVSSGISCEDFQDEKAKIMRSFEGSHNKFPIDVFPDLIQKIILSTNSCLNYPIDFIAAAILYAASVAIGNTHQIQVKNGYVQSVVLYIALVGNPGTNKSHPLSFALKAIEDFDNKNFREYLKQKDEFSAYQALSKKEKSEYGEAPPVPYLKQSLVSDFTPESLIDILSINRRGIGVYVDELASWFKNFNRYNNGSEEQFWLSAWSTKAIRVNRKSSDPHFLKRPFISVIGTMQPGILKELAKNRTENGFIDRILFVMPENLKKDYWGEEELSMEIIKDWQKVITNLLFVQPDYNETGDVEPKIVELSSNAKAIAFDWQRELTDKCNETTDELILRLYSKMEQYMLRFALILQLLKYSCNNGSNLEIGADAVNGAIKLTNYFIQNALKAHEIISNTSRLDNLSTDKRQFYEKLPLTFQTNEAVSTGKALNISERTVKYFLSDQNYFKREKKGLYTKNISQN